MKNLLVLLFALLLTSCTDHNQSQTDRNHATPNPSADYIVMQQGKMMRSQGGEMTPMTSNVMMGNGSVGMTDGTYRRKDGTTMHLTEGQRMLLNGNMMQNGMMNGGMMNEGQTGHLNHLKR